MINLNLTVFAVCFLVFILFKLGRQSSSGNQYGSIQQSGSLQCNWTIMIAYGMTGLSKPSQSSHKYCSGIKMNCCSDSDQDLSIKTWNDTNWILIEKYYYLYAIMIKYVLGYSQEAKLLSMDYQNTDNPQCQSVYKTLNQMSTNFTQLDNIYRTIVNGINQMATLRSSFFCSICDATFQDAFLNQSVVEKVFYNSRLYFSVDFCKTMVEKTITANYYKIFYLKEIASNISQIINCKTGDIALDYSQGFIDAQIVMNCMNYQSNYFYFFCEPYCQQYHFTKTTIQFDGEIDTLKTFVQQIMKYRQQIFQDPENNILMYYLTYEEDMMNMSMKNFTNSQSFFPSNTQLNFDSFNTDVVYYGYGMNPWTHADKNSFEITFTEGVAKNCILLLALVLLFI